MRTMLKICMGDGMHLFACIPDLLCDVERSTCSPHYPGNVQDVLISILLFITVFLWLANLVRDRRLLWSLSFVWLTGFLSLWACQLAYYVWLLIVQMKVVGNNLLNVCKIVYKLSCPENNDQLFLEEELLGRWSRRQMNHMECKSVLNF